MDASTPRRVPRALVRLPALLAVLLLALAACAAPAATVPPDATGTIAPASTATPAAVPSASAQPSAAAFPLTLVDDEGTTVEIPARPERVVSLTPATTELLFALGAGDRVVGRVEDVSLHPPDAEPIPVVATFQGVDVEQVVALEPDLVVAGGNGLNPPDDIAQLRNLGIPVLVVWAPDLEGVLHDLELTARAVGEEAAARELLDRLAAEFDAVEAATRDLPRPRVFYELDATSEIYGPTDDSFIEEMIVLAGGEAVTTGSTTVFSIPLERLVAADPEVIVLGDANYGVTPEQVAARPGWGDMTAVREGAIRPVDDVVVTRPGPRLGEGLRALAQAIHPDLVLPSPGAS